MYISKDFMGIAVVMLILFLFFSFSPLPEVSLVEDGTAYLVESSWWGLVKDEHEIRLNGTEWQVKSDDGEWSPINFE